MYFTKSLPSAPKDVKAGPHRRDSNCRCQNPRSRHARRFHGRVEIPHGQVHPSRRLVDTLTTAAEAEALTNWVALHHRTLTTIYITHGHFDHFAGLSVLLHPFPDARAIATPKSVELMRKQSQLMPVFRKL